MIEKIVLISLLSTFMLVCMHKWRWIDRYQAYYGHVKWMRVVIGPGDCFFCVGLRIAAIVTLLMWQQFTFEYMVIPVCAAPMISLLTMAITYNDGNKTR